MPAIQDCEIIRPLLSVYVDNEATDAEAAFVDEHVAVCARCASELSFLFTSHIVLHRLPQELPPPSLRARIAAATYARPTLGRRIADFLQPAPTRLALGTAMAVGIVAAAVVLRAPSAPSPPDRVATGAPPQVQAPAPQAQTPAPEPPAVAASAPAPARIVKVAPADTARPSRTNKAVVDRQVAAAKTEKTVTDGRQNRQAPRTVAPAEKIVVAAAAPSKARVPAVSPGRVRPAVDAPSIKTVAAQPGTARPLVYEAPAIVTPTRSSVNEATPVLPPPPAPTVSVARAESPRPEVAADGTIRLPQTPRNTTPVLPIAFAKPRGSSLPRPESYTFADNSGGKGKFVTAETN